MTIYEDEDALSFLSGGTGFSSANVRCPHCKSEYTKVDHVGTLTGGDEGILAYQGTSSIGTTPYRRSAVAIVFNCEGCPRLFSLVIQQHKGESLIQIHADIDSDERRHSYSTVTPK